MANSFNLSDKPEILANLVQILSNASALATIQVTTLPDIATQNTNIKAVVDAIADPQLPNILTAVGANETKIDNVKTVADLIKLKTDTVPQNIRGKWYQARLTTANAAFQDVVNVTGHGRVNQVMFKLDDLGDTIEIRITLDGTAWDDLSYTGADTDKIIVPNAFPSNLAAIQLLVLPYVTTSIFYFDLEFEDSLLIQIRRSAGAAGNVNCKVNYTLDSY